jgi:hypothetical protein
MPFTYTYTARSQENPDRAVTYTIFDDHLKVDLTGLFDQLTEVVDAENREEAVKEMISTHSGTGLYKAIEKMSGPAHINDVYPHFDGAKLKVTFWKRLAGLRIAPVVTIMGEVDNPEAAAKFVEVLRERQDQTESPGIFAGPLDYWFTWIGLLIGVIALVKWPKKQSEQKDS